MEEHTILHTLQKVASSDTVPMHMPGHKRNGDLAPYLKQLGVELDITEIHGCDCLHHADGIIRRAMDRASGLWRVPNSFLLVNGSTGGILSAIHAATRPGDGVLMARGCHKAVYNGVALCGLEVEYLLQHQSQEGYYQCVSPQDVESALEANKNIKLVVITSPTFDGYLADVAQIADICHRQGVILMVDEAHGAHLGFCDYFTGSAVQAGADMVVQSVHKTLPSLTQTAILHVQGDLVDAKQVAHSLSIFETSSPSYLLMASIDGCLQLLEERGSILFAQWQRRLEKFYRKAAGLQHLSVVQEPLQVKDPSKILISTANVSLDGTQLKELLRTEFHIELEMAFGDYALAMTGMGDRAENLAWLWEGLAVIDQRLMSAPNKKISYTVEKLPVQALSPRQLHRAAIVPKGVETAVGCVCGSYLWAYPPGVPILAPGEVVEEDTLELLQKLEANGVEIQDTKGFWPEKIATIPMGNP